MMWFQLTNDSWAKIDDEDFERVSEFYWFEKKFPYGISYAARTVRVGEKFKTVYMHRFIMNCMNGKVVHHVNGETLDNRKSNLQIITKQENLARRYR